MISITEKVKFIESAFGSGRLWKNSPNFDVRCPICDSKDATKKKLSIRLDNDANHCWVCGWKARSLVPLLKKYSTFEKLNEYVTRFNVSKKHMLNVDDDKTRIVKLPDDFRLLNDPCSRNDPDSIAVKNYLIRDRSMSVNDLWYYKIGTSRESRWSRRALMPSFDNDGNLNYFVGRACDSRRRPKYDNSDADKVSIIFNEINIDWKSRLVVCEGPFDLVKCGDNAVALLGSDLDERYALFDRIITESPQVALALDADMWESKTLRIAQKLSEYNVNVTIVDTRPFGDPGQASKQQFSDALESASIFDWISKFKNRLNKASRQTLRMSP